MQCLTNIQCKMICDLQTPINTMNKNFPFLALAVALTLGSSLAQENSDQQNPGYSSIPSIAQEGTAPEEAIQPYEVTLDDLVNTPWDASLSHLSNTIKSDPNFHTVALTSVKEQTLAPLSITLEKGQNLVVHMSNSQGLRCLENFPDSDSHFIRTGSTGNMISTTNWNGWSNYMRGDTPLEENDLQVRGGLPIQHRVGTSATYSFKNNHAGQSTLKFYYCILGSDQKPSELQFNTKELTVICK